MSPDRTARPPGGQRTRRLYGLSTTFALSVHSPKFVCRQHGDCLWRQIWKPCCLAHTLPEGRPRRPGGRRHTAPLTDARGRRASCFLCSGLNLLPLGVFGATAGRRIRETPLSTSQGGLVCFVLLVRSEVYDPGALFWNPGWIRRTAIRTITQRSSQARASSIFL
jgi:hypothetical protein